MKGYYQKAPSVKKAFPKPKPTEQYEQPLGPERPTKMQRFESEHQFLSGAVHRVKDAAYSGAAWMQKRGEEINRESRAPPRRSSRRGRAAPMMSMPADPFGMSRGGNPFGDQIRREAPAPRRRRRKRRRDYDDDRRTPAFADPFHIPDSMRHMF